MRLRLTLLLLCFALPAYADTLTATVNRDNGVTQTTEPLVLTPANLGALQSSGIAKITAATSAPISPSVGDLWHDTNFTRSSTTVFAGASATLSYYTLGFPQMLTTSLPLDFPTQSFTFYNEGVGGTSSQDWSGYISTKITNHSPSIVTLMLGTNDSKDVSIPGNHHVDIGPFSTYMQQIIDAVKASGAKLVLITPTPVNEGASAPAAGFTDAALVPYAQAVRTLAATNHLPIVDAYNIIHAYYGTPRYNSLFIPDGIHLTDEGYRLLYPAIYAKFADIVSNTVKRWDGYNWVSTTVPSRQPAENFGGMRGPWLSTMLYQLNDIVIYSDGNSYICNRSNTNTNPSTDLGTYWSQYAKKANAINGIAKVGMSNSYSDLDGQPTLPSTVSCGAGNHVSAYNSATGTYTCSADTSNVSMTWPSGAAGIANYNGSSGWGASYSASNQIPFNFLAGVQAAGSYLTSESDPKVGSTTSGNFCKGTGTQISCTDSNSYLQSTAQATDSDKLDGQHGSYYLTTANQTDSADKRFMTDAQRTVVNSTSGANSGDETQATIQSKLSTSTDGAVTQLKQGPTEAASVVKFKLTGNSGLGNLDTATLTSAGVFTLIAPGSQGAITARTYSNTAGNRTTLSFSKATGTTTPGIVTSADEFGTIAFGGYDGAANQYGATIDGWADGTPASGSIPARLEFTTGASAGTRAARLKIFSTGGICGGSSSCTDPGAAKFNFAGDVAATTFNGSPLGSAAYTASTAYLAATAQATDSDKLDGQHGSYYATAVQGAKADSAIQEGSTHSQGTSTTLDVGAKDGFQISAASGTVSLTVSNLANGKYFDIEITSTSGALTLNAPLFTGATFPNGNNSTTVSAGKSSHYVCKGTGSSTAKCYVLAESK